MKLLSERLAEALALVDKATPGELFVYDANEGDGWPPRPLWCFKNAAYDSEDEEAQVVQGSLHYSGKEDADALVAAINFLREHGPAIAAALRAVEGAAWIPCSERLPEHYEHVETWPPYDEQTYNFYAHRDGGTNGVKAGNWYHNDREGYDWQFSPTHWRRISAPLDAAGSAEGGS